MKRQGKITIGKWFVDPQNGKTYRFIDHRDTNGKLISRTCQEKSKAHRIVGRVRC